MLAITEIKSVRVSPVDDSDYFPLLKSMIAECSHRLLCSLFIIDIVPRAVRHSYVDELLCLIKAAHLRGIDARIIVSGSNTSLAILGTSAVAVKRIGQLGIPVRWAAKYKNPSHAKLVICDNNVLIGSHNWSYNAFFASVQDSVIVYSEQLASVMATEFDQNWSKYEQ